MLSMLFAVQPTNQAKQPQVTRSKRVSPQSRKLAAERQQHAGTVAGLDAITPLSAQLLEKMRQLRERQSLRIGV